MIEAVVFDFDGVILQSNDIKTEAFRRLFADEPDHVNQIVDMHLAHQGISRHKKLQWAYEQILDRPLSEEHLAQLADRFSELVLDAVLACPFIEGALELLQRRHVSTPLFVASGTPQDELCHIASERSVNTYFKGVFGAPATKSEILVDILTELELEPKQALFVGDALTDIEGARAVGVPFLGIVPEANLNPFADEEVPIVRNMRELDELWDELRVTPPPAPLALA